jgi:PilZ domain
MPRPWKSLASPGILGYPDFPAVIRRRSLTPPIGMPLPGLPPTRRQGGARRNVSFRVVLYRGALEIPGWALNLSRGGLRAVVEERVDIGEELDVRLDEELEPRRGRVVWSQDEPDGTIVGMSFLERLETAPRGVEFESSLELSPAELARKSGMTEEELKALIAATTDKPGGGPGSPPA